MQLELDFREMHSLEINYQQKNDRPGYKVVEYLDINNLSGRKKVRLLCKPNNELRLVHEIMKKELTPIYTRANLPHAFQWIKGIRNPVISSIEDHKKDKKYFSRYWFVTDLKSAYHSVDLVKLAIILEMKSLEETGKRLPWVEALVLFCVDPNMTLAEGLPISPWLFNIYAGYELDTRLAMMARKYSGHFTRLGDDLIFSSSKPFGKRKRKAILDFIRGKGFQISEKKTKTFDLTKQGVAFVNGVGIRNMPDGGEVFLPRNYRRKIKGLLHVALYGMDSDPFIFRHKIAGMMGVYMSMISTVSGFSNEDKKIIRMYKDFKKKFEKLYPEINISFDPDSPF